MAAEDPLEAAEEEAEVEVEVVDAAAVVAAVSFHINLISKIYNTKLQRYRMIGRGGGMKGGAKVVIEAHRHEGVFIAKAKEDALVTLNSTPGKDVYGEKRIQVSNFFRKFYIPGLVS